MTSDRIDHAALRAERARTIDEERAAWDRGDAEAAKRAMARRAEIDELLHQATSVPADRVTSPLPTGTLSSTTTPAEEEGPSSRPSGRSQARR